MSKERMTAENTALLIVDMQDKMYPVMYNREILLKPNLTLLTVAKEFGLTVLATEQYPEGLGTSLYEIQERFKELNVTPLAKTCFTAALPEILRVLEEKHIKNVIVSGIEAHICVYQTCRSLLDLGYHVYLAEDAVGSRRLENRNNAIDQIRTLGGIITNSETIAFDFLKDAKDPRFKAISKAVK